MKKFVRVCSWILIAAMLLGGCGAPGGTENVPEPFTDEPTDELNFYVTTNQEDYFKNKIGRKFTERYPEVTLNITAIDSSEINSRINSELMSGTGPDLIFLDQVDNIYKSMKAGVFADLNPILEQDPTFRMSEFYETVMDAGVMNGKRYVMPLGFGISTMVSTKNLLKQYDFQPENCTDFSGLMDEMNKYLDNNLSSMEAMPILDSYSWQDEAFQLWNYSGISLCDYESGKITIDESKLKSVLDKTKKLYCLSEEDMPLISSETDGVLKSKYLLDYSSRLGSYSPFLVEYLRSNGADPALIVTPTLDGGVQALIYRGVGISANSRNKVNAYHFISLLLGIDCQNEYYATSNLQVPVRREAALVDLLKRQNTFKPQKFDTHEKADNVSGLNEELQKFSDALENITSCSFPNYTVLNEMVNCFDPYLKEEKSFEACLDEYKQYLTLYLSE